MNIYESALSIQDEIAEYRRHIHQHPERGFYLPETAAYVQSCLAEMGIISTFCGGPIDRKTRENFVFAGFPDMEESTGVVATIGSGSPCILLRADMDALPIQETPGHVPFTSSKEGISHMCGHDAHTAMLLGAARILKEHEAELPGTVKLMFQTGEECGCGSRFMVEHGVLKNPKVDAAFALHVMPNQKLGTVGYAAGISSAAMDTYMIRIQGKGGHSSTPQDCIDPLMIANQLYTTLNLFSGREIDPRETVALTAGQCGGGEVANVIPDTAQLMVCARTFNRDVTSHLVTRIPELVEHTVKMWRGDYEMIHFHTPSTYTDPALCEELKPYIVEIVGEENIQQIPGMAGTEDFGYVTEQVPGMFLFVGAGEPDAAPLHNPDMVLDERVLPLGAAINANLALQWLKGHKA
ncbi:MAG: M20 family metallopeptidase [Lachnospiraceae bacterium]|nr:M20 family metallopeptidase [Lachnospiraceae bacterium]